MPLADQIFVEYLAVLKEVYDVLLVAQFSLQEALVAPKEKGQIFQSKKNWKIIN